MPACVFLVSKAKTRQGWESARRREEGGGEDARRQLAIAAWPREEPEESEGCYFV